MSTLPTMTKAVALFATASITAMGQAARSSGSGKPISIEYLLRAQRRRRQSGCQDVFAVLAEANQTLNPDFRRQPSFSTVAAKMVDVGDHVFEGKAKIVDILTATREESVATLKCLNLPVAE